MNKTSNYSKMNKNVRKIVLERQGVTMEVKNHTFFNSFSKFKNNEICKGFDTLGIFSKVQDSEYFKTSFQRPRVIQKYHFFHL